jgi:hypothetical protein
MASSYCPVFISVVVEGVAIWININRLPTGIARYGHVIRMPMTGLHCSHRLVTRKKP